LKSYITLIVRMMLSFYKINKWLMVPILVNVVFPNTVIMTKRESQKEGVVVYVTSFSFSLFA